MPSLVAIVVTHDSAHALPGCLAALAAEHVPALVVDNASRDASVALAEAAGAQVVRNAATRATAGPTIAGSVPPSRPNGF